MGTHEPRDQVRGAAAGPGREALVEAVMAWFDGHQRDLPWRRDDRTPWGVLVSEVMLQQTPVVRVLPVWQDWMARWPTPAGLAAEPPGEAVRRWGRLGYPRRALALHSTARLLVGRHAGRVPDDDAQLRALPGVGEYTSAAVRAFAFWQRCVVLDTNVRRVHARVLGGHEHPPAALTAAERDRAAHLLPQQAAQAARWSVAVMELGALVCTSTGPRCPQCPIAAQCAWLARGRPPHDGPPRRVQRFAGTDRQARGRIMAVLREHLGPVAAEVVAAAWPDPVQRARALDGLVADGLVEPLESGMLRLPVDPAVCRNGA